MFENIKTNKQNIIKDLQDELFSGLPYKASIHLNNPDPFINPISTSIHEMLETLFDQITGEMDINKILPSLDNYFKIMALQDYSPSQAIGFLLSLKKLLYKKTGLEGKQEIKLSEISILEDRIDDILLHSFDIYMKCRENIYTIRINEFKKRSFRALGNIK